MDDAGKLLIATSNPGKVAEIRQILGDLSFELCTLQDVRGCPAAVEDADTFMANAEKKAVHFAVHTGLLTLADDSGLEVDALGGMPGVRSARFGGEPRSDQANNARLIAELRAVPAEQRTARFRCSVAVAQGTRIVARAEGHIDGLIIDEPRGTNGFGYDPHFLIPHLGRTTAELAPDEKNGISHRGRALRALRHQLADLLRDAATPGPDAHPR